MKIYIAENDLDCQLIFEKALEKIESDTNVRFFNNGEILIENLSSNENKPDIILLDARMPIMDGLETLKKLKSNRATKNIPAIIMSGLIDEDIKDEIFEAGALDYIMKPFTFGGLVKVLKLLKKYAGVENHSANQRITRQSHT